MSTQNIDIRKIIAEYAPDPLNDTDDTLALKNAIELLPEADRRILILYADLGSIRKVAMMLDTTYYYVQLKLKEIKQKIYDTIEII